MVNIGAGVADIINDPMSRGIGSSISSNVTQMKSIKQVQKTWKKTPAVITGKMTTQKNTVKSVLSNNQSKTAAQKNLNALGNVVIDTVNNTGKSVQNAVNENTIGELTRQLLGKDTKGITLTSLVDMTMKKSIDSMLQDEIKKGKLSLQTSKLGTTYATARAYYKKLYDGDIIMTDLRNKAEKNISNAINKSINDKLFSWQNKLPSWSKNILAASKLTSSLQKFVRLETKNCIEAIFGDSVIKNWNSTLVKNLNKIKGTIQDQFQKTFKGGIEYYKKLRQAIADKIKVYQEMKQRFEKHIASVINDFKQKIVGAIQDFTKELVSSIGDSVKTAVAGIKL